MSKILRCDARCHNAKGEQCLCWCGGAFHGAKNKETREKFIEDIKTGVQELPYGVSYSPEKKVWLSRTFEPEEQLF